jgi:hypothetical protein
VTSTKLCSIDTNVLVRYIARDDKTQTAIATKLIESSGFKALDPGFNRNHGGLNAPVRYW